MATLILYASKHGAAKEIAGRIAGKIEGAVMCDLKQSDIPALSDFDCVIIGSSLYAGSMRGEAKAFIAKNADELCGKSVGLFLSGFSVSDSDFEKNFPPKLLQAAKAKAFLGGIFDPQKATAIERFIIKIVMKKAAYIERIDDDAIAKFADAMKGMS